MIRNEIRKHKYNKKRTFLFLFLIIMLLGISLAYSFLSVSIGYNGISTISAATWDVHFANIVVDSGSVTAITPVTISETDTTTINFTAQLNKPGDYYEFTVDIVNNGTINATIDSIVMLPDISNKKYLKYTATYSDGNAIAKDDLLLANTKKTINVSMRYEECESDTDYPAELTQHDINFTLNYVQYTAKNT